MSIVKKSIDTNKPYLNYYFFSTKDVSIKTDNVKIKSNEELELDEKLKNNPIIYCFDKTGKILYEKHFLDFHSKSYIKKAMLKKDTL